MKNGRIKAELKLYEFVLLVGLLMYLNDSVAQNLYCIKDQAQFAKHVEHNSSTINDRNGGFCKKETHPYPARADVRSCSS